ncbi:hypothetical protein HHI36_002810 [Cryptolaemus montrouzieri]|uniref:MARVEL domain-containing protein n=1 Tax=Cryptolaemus montrouzieri TaxID=559131 RepID=A0ABD2PC22_9CUCU
MDEDEEAAQPRKSLYMRLAPIVDTYDEVVKNKLETGKFPFTWAGIIKTIGMLCLIASIGLFFATPLCEDTSTWYPYLFPSSLSISITTMLILYIIFSSGYTTKNPSVWVNFDIGINLISAFVSIFSSIATMCDCGNEDFSQVIIGVVGICGCITSVVGCISIFLMYRFVEQIPTMPQSRRPFDPRKSVFA